MPLHPLIVHFPIVFILIACAGYIGYMLKNDAFSLQSAIYAHIAGIVGFALSIVTGQWAEADTPHTPAIHEMIEQHGLLSWVSVWVFALLYVWQLLRVKKMPVWEKWLFVAIFVGGTGIMGFSAHLGGRMVYEKGAGVLPMKEINMQEVKKMP